MTLLLLPDLFVFVNTRIFCVCQQKVNISCVCNFTLPKQTSKQSGHYILFDEEVNIFCMGSQAAVVIFSRIFGNKCEIGMDKHRKIISSVC